MRLALGTVQFGLPYGIANHVLHPETKEMLQLVAANGIDTIYTGSEVPVQYRSTGHHQSSSLCLSASVGLLSGCGKVDFPSITTRPRNPT